MSTEERRPETGALPPAEAVRLGELLAHQTGAVVSRTLAKTPGGTVTLFAFDAGQGLSEHTAPFDAIVQLLDGEADFTIGGKAVRLRSGEAVLMPAHVPHGLQALVPMKMLLVMLRDPTPAK